MKRATWTLWLFTNYVSRCQGQSRDKQGQAGTSRQGRDKQGHSLSVPDCPFLSLSLLACPSLPLSVPVCPCLPFSVPVCPCLSFFCPCMSLSVLFCPCVSLYVSTFAIPSCLPLQMNITVFISMYIVTLTFLAKGTVPMHANLVFNLFLTFHLAS